MIEDIKFLNNIRTLRAQACNTSLDTLEELLEKFTSIVEDKRQENEADKKEREERKIKLDAIREQLLSDGIDPIELVSNNNSASTKQNSIRSPRPAKYKYIDESGNEKNWAGYGRTPKAIASAIEKDKKLEGFII